VWGPLTTAIEAKSDRELQCTAAEVVAGLHVGSHAWAPSDTGVMSAKLSELLSATLPATEPGSVDFWAMGLRYMVCNRDPRRTPWLSKLAASLTSTAPDAKSSDISRGLKMQQSSDISRGLKMQQVALGSNMHLGGTSKTVREEAGRGLVLIAKSLLPRQDGSAQSPSTATEISSWLLPLLPQLHTAYLAAPLDATTQASIYL
ncbi:hypothetical protein T484DRAFT_1790889, partial [Baffinella frigidus]